MKKVRSGGIKKIELMIRKTFSTLHNKAKVIRSYNLATRLENRKIVKPKKKKQ